MHKTLANPANPNAAPLLEIVMNALEAKRRIPSQPPKTTLPRGFDHDALRAFRIDQVDGGYIANIEFDMAPGEANTIGTPEARPFPTYREAFLAGATILCEVVTGSPGLPFILLGDELVVVAVTPRGAPIILRRPLPTQCA